MKQALLALAVLLTACGGSGSGDGLFRNGSPPDQDAGPVDAQPQHVTGDDAGGTRVAVGTGVGGGKAMGPGNTGTSPVATSDAGDPHHCPAGYPWDPMIGYCERDDTATGGASGSGGAGSGGSMESGGTSGTGGEPACGSGEKLCAGRCVPRTPASGCGASDCTPCAASAPANGFVACNTSGVCDFDCLSGFPKSGVTCGGGTTGAGGASSVCPTGCPAACAGQDWCLHYGYHGVTVPTGCGPEWAQTIYCQ